MDHKLLACMAQLAQSKSRLLTHEARLWQILSHALTDECRKGFKKPTFQPAPLPKDAEAIPPEGFMRLDGVLKLIPMSAASWWRGVQLGLYPKPIKISTGITVWRNADVLELIRKFSENSKLNESLVSRDAKELHRQG